MELSEKHAVESTVIGEYNDSGYLRLDYKGKTCALISMDFMESDFPQWEFDAEWTPPQLRGLREPVLSEPKKHGDILKEILSRPNICSRNWIARQYDHEVQGGSIIKPLVGKSRDIPTDAVVVNPVLGSKRGIATSQTLNPLYSEIDTYHMTAVTIDETVRKVLAVGGDPDHLGGVDNFCWPTVQYHPRLNPDGKYKAAQLVRSNWALRDLCLGFGIPLLSGKDSMYIDGNLEGPYGERRKISGLPTLLFTISSVVRDIEKCVTMESKVPGDLVYVIGETRNELGGSEYYQLFNELGLNVPQVNVEGLLPSYLVLSKAISDGLVSSAHAVSRGGLAAHLALVAIGGETGMEIKLKNIPSADNLSNTEILYSESAGRFVVTIDPARKKSFEKLFRGTKIGLAGKVTDSERFIISGKTGNEIINEDVLTLKAFWKKPFGGLV
jgi:phosphoribosylformylglycinamidine (FGAM) synthase-like enzyme